MRSMGEELDYLESLEATHIDEKIINSFEEYLTISETMGEYEGFKKTLLNFLVYSILIVFIFSQMNAGVGFKYDLSKLLTKLPIFLQTLFQGIIYASLGWTITIKRMNTLEKKIFNILWTRHVSLITFLTGATFWLFGSVPPYGLITWIIGAYLGAYLATKD